MGMPNPALLTSPKGITLAPRYYLTCSSLPRPILLTYGAMVRVLTAPCLSPGPRSVLHDPSPPHPIPQKHGLITVRYNGSMVRIRTAPGLPSVCAGLPALVANCRSNRTSAWLGRRDDGPIPSYRQIIQAACGYLHAIPLSSKQKRFFLTKQKKPIIDFVPSFERHRLHYGSPIR